MTSVFGVQGRHGRDPPTFVCLASHSGYRRTSQKASRKDRPSLHLDKRAQPKIGGLPSEAALSSRSSFSECWRSCSPWLCCIGGMIERTSIGCAYTPASRNTVHYRCPRRCCLPSRSTRPAAQHNPVRLGCVALHPSIWSRHATVRRNRLEAASIARSRSTLGLDLCR
jgi:hypothetical protein